MSATCFTHADGPRFVVFNRKTYEVVRICKTQAGAKRSAYGWWNRTGKSFGVRLAR